MKTSSSGVKVPVFNHWHNITGEDTNYVKGHKKLLERVILWNIMLLGIVVFGVTDFKTHNEAITAM